MNPTTAQQIPQTVYEAEPANPPPIEKGPAPPPAHATELGHDAKHPPTCAICLLPIQVGNPVKQLCCAHAFHAFCVDQWLQKELHCPICKVQVLFPVAEAVKLHAERTNKYAGPSQPVQSHEPHKQEQQYAAAYQIPPTCHTPMAVPVEGVDGTDARLYGTCRDCKQAFYRDLTTVRPETAAWYRCPKCRDGDIFDLLRSSCVLQ
ncbi:hypothetical protein Gpo141_00005571 [Globisporangium polare]